MPIDARTFNGRITSEALEAKFRQAFPAQGGSEIVADLYASGVIQPVVDFTQVAEGSILREDLQKAYDLATTDAQAINTTTNLINTPGFWRVRVTATVNAALSGSSCQMTITDGVIINQVLFKFQGVGTGNDQETVDSQELIVFVRTGDSVNLTSNDPSAIIHATVRQVADVYGNLVNPSGYVSQ